MFRSFARISRYIPVSPITSGFCSEAKVTSFVLSRQPEFRINKQLNYSKKFHTSPSTSAYST